MPAPTLEEDALVHVLDEDEIPSIDDPALSRDPDLPDDAAVVGVEVEGEARAYPVAILDWHEVANDVVGGIPVAVTYCPLCGTGLAFDRRVEGRVLTFGVSGCLYKNDLVLFDRETGSYWSQLPGRAIRGPLEGAELEVVPTDLTTLGAWRRAHPDGPVLEPPSEAGTYAGEPIDYGLDPHPGYDRDHDDIRFPRVHTDDRLPAKTRVVGVVLDGEARAYPRESLPDRGLARDGDVLLVCLDGRLRAYRGATGWRLEDDELVGPQGRRVDAARAEGPGWERLTLRPAYWFTWVDFFPDTEIRRPEPP